MAKKETKVKEVKAEKKAKRVMQTPTLDIQDSIQVLYDRLGYKLGDKNGNLRDITVLYEKIIDSNFQLNKRIDRLIEAIDKCKRIKGI